MRADFQPCLAQVLIYEGGFSNDPRDPGGATLNGITQGTYDAERRRMGLATRPVNMMMSMERDEIYRNGFWVPTECDDLSAGMDLVVFDASVNSGPAQAIRWLRGVNQATPVAAIHAYCANRLSFMHAIRGGNLWRAFGKGWGARVASVEALAVNMATAGSPSQGPYIAAQATIARGHADDAKVAGHVITGSGAIVVGGPIVSGHSGLVIIAALGACVVLAGVILYLKSRQQAQRADAFEAIAKEK